MKNYLLAFIALACIACNPDPDPPLIESVEPAFGPAETLVTFEGANLANLKTITFSDQEVNFNTAYNSDVALLFRIPTNVPLGEHTVEFVTDGGVATTTFRVTLDPPAIFSINPEFASPGETVTIFGKNFFDPVEVFFFDSVRAEILTLAPDSIVVEVPENIEKGRVTVVANGGATESPVNFFSVDPILINDFDGNGLRSQTNRWGFVGQVDQNANNAVVADGPTGNYLELTGTDDLDIAWIGGAQSDFGFPGDDFTDFGIETDINNTLLEMDVSNNGQTNTFLSLILLENDGLTTDFVHEIAVDWNGWERVSIPLNRFKNFEGVSVDPAKIKVIKIHMIDQNDSDEQLEVRVDNVRFVQIF